MILHLRLAQCGRSKAPALDAKGGIVSGLFGAFQGCDRLGPTEVLVVRQFANRVDAKSILELCRIARGYARNGIHRGIQYPVSDFDS